LKYTFKMNIFYHKFDFELPADILDYEFDEALFNKLVEELIFEQLQEENCCWELVEELLLEDERLSISYEAFVDCLLQEVFRESHQN